MFFSQNLCVQLFFSLKLQLKYLYLSLVILITYLLNNGASISNF